MNQDETNGRNAIKESPTRPLRRGLFQKFAEQIDLGISATDEHGTLVFWNAALEQMLGLPAKAAIGRPLWNVQFDLTLPPSQTPETLHRLQATVLSTLEKGKCDKQGQFAELEHQRQDGKTILLLGTTYVIPTHQGYCLFNIYLDLASIQGVNESLKFNAAKFRAVVEQAGDGILVFDDQGLVLDWNQGCENLTGISRAQAIGNRLTDLFPDLFQNVDWNLNDAGNSSHDQLTRNLPLIARSRLPRTFEGPVEHITGMRKWVHAVTFAIRTEKNRWFGMIARDMTPLKQGEQRLERYARQLETLRLAGLEISAELGMDALIWMIAPRSVELLNGNAMALYLYNPEKDRLELAISLGDNQPALQKYVKRGEALAGRVCETGKSVLLDDYHTGRTSDLGKSYWGKVAGAPINWASEFLGVIFVFSDQSFVANDLKMLELFSAHAAAALRNARLHHQISQMAVTDSLTGIYNRRYFFELAEKEFRESTRYRRPMSVVIFDLDHFKKVNDTFGHARGDEILRAVVQRCAENIRHPDTIGRYGGEEFVILLPETDGEQGFTLIERLRQTLASTPVETDTTPALVTASFGIATLQHDVTNLLTLINRADVALYHAKQAGRNRCLLWTNEMQDEIPQT
jgi:diguanylate cyclase (GGDEF)-like protein/PAS domain S-box-containing protein